ncbi:MAG: plasmid pRiA4b ORF-3 family protein [Treponema sp.]|nr:plasmid pRiA4b ORF-3 family protein [Treponema sp.]
MDLEQEELLYEFLDNTTVPFTLDDIVLYVQNTGQKRNKRLHGEIGSYLDDRKIAFRQDNRHWVSRRGCFESAVFTITPSRLELINGILIPGHRCIPFANPLIMPHRYKFFWRSKLIPTTTTESPPEDLYPYYSLYGEEFAPQYIARENPENEAAFNADLYEDPPEVSIRTLDMRGIYRECAFVPGDRFVVRTLNWQESSFELTKVTMEDWSTAELDKWLEAAESGFENSFALLGPGTSMEEQFAFAYWYGGKRMREVPSFSLEEFLYEKTNRIDIVPYGIETRCWFAGKEIPDTKTLQSFSVPPDRTFIESILFDLNIPISEFVVLAYIKDAFFRNETDVEKVINRLVPPVIDLDDDEWELLTEFIADNMEEFIQTYSPFPDRDTGVLRQRVAELHTAVIELSAKLQEQLSQKGNIEVQAEFAAWLPKHTFIVLSQIQGHTAALLEDLAFDETVPDSDVTAMDNSLDSMIDTFTDIKELIRTAMDNYRQSNFTVIHGGKTSQWQRQLWRMIQLSIVNLDIWRRAIISHDSTMEDIHKLIQAGMSWSGTLRFRFYCELPCGDKEYLHDKIKLGDINFRGKKELVYEYAKWTVKIIIMSSYQPANIEKTRFIAGEGAAPPENVDGPRHFKKLLMAQQHDILEIDGIMNKQPARFELGVESSSNGFDLEKANHKLRETFPDDV